MFLLHNTASKDPTVPATIRLDPSNVTALGFTLSGLLGSRPTSPHAHLFVTAILACMVVVLPSHNLHPGCMEEQIFESVQKGTLMWCIGLVIAAVVLTRNPTKGVSALYGER